LSSDTVRIETVRPASRSRKGVIASATTDAWRLSALVWVVHWLLTQLPATLAYHYGTVKTIRENPPRSGVYEPDFGPKSGAYGVVLDPLQGLAGWLVEPFRNWDGTWYRLVATEGYNPEMAAKAAFWPLYPWLMDVGARLTGWTPETIGYLISNIAFFFALYFLFRLVSHDFDVTVAQRTLWAVALFPTAFFFNAVYTESLFFLLVVAALFMARRGDWWLAGGVGLLAALTRSAGVMLLAPFAVLFLQQYGALFRPNALRVIGSLIVSAAAIALAVLMYSSWGFGVVILLIPTLWSVKEGSVAPKVFAAALPALGPLIFGYVLRENGLKFLDWADQQWQWNRFSATPWRTFDCTLNGCEAEVRFISGQTGESYVHPIDWGWISQLFDNLNWTFITSSEFRFRFGESHVLELVVTVLAILLVLIGLRLVPLYYTAFVVPALIVPLLTPSSVNPLMSMPRFVLPLFPLFVVAALLIRNWTLGWVLAACSSFLLVILSMQFALWYWVS
jgi:hypothetical protein